MVPGYEEPLALKKDSIIGGCEFYNSCNSLNRSRVNCTGGTGFNLLYSLRCSGPAQSQTLNEVHANLARTAGWSIRTGHEKDSLPRVEAFSKIKRGLAGATSN